MKASNIIIVRIGDIAFYTYDPNTQMSYTSSIEYLIKEDQTIDLSITYKSERKKGLSPVSEVSSL
jgi:hypothetical protein